MTTCTPVYGLTYQTCSDRPCDAPGAWCQFAADVEAQLDLLDDIVDRTVDTTPMAQIRLTVPVTLDASVLVGIPFDTVDVDTADMVNLTMDAYAITLPRQGRYFFYYQFQGNTIGVGNTVSVGLRSGNFLDQWLDDASTPIFLNASAEGAYITPAAASGDLSNARVDLGVTAGGTGSITVTAVTFGIYWLGDIP